MLVLTRRVDEEIVIGDIVRVRIVAVNNQRVKVGIMAPRQVSVHREEVHQRLQEFNDCPGCSEQHADPVGSEQRSGLGESRNDAAISAAVGSIMG